MFSSRRESLVVPGIGTIHGFRASGVKRGTMLRKSDLSNVVFSSIFPVRNPSRHVFDRHLRVNAVLIIEVNSIDSEPLEGTLEALSDALGPTVLDLLPAGIHLDPELGGHHHLPAERSQSFAYEFFIRVLTGVLWRRIS